MTKRSDALPSVAIVADDLTGALDSAVGFARGGRRVVVARHRGAISEALAARPDVLAVNAATREGGVGQARAVMRDIAASLDLERIPCVLKKVDSRLKGHPGAEVAELTRVLGSRGLVVAPAIPSMGRVQRGGLLSGEGLASQVDIAACFEDPVEVPDLESDADFDAVVVGAAPGALWVGARGLAFALGRAVFDGEPAEAPQLAAPALFVLGSRDPITGAQLEKLQGVSRIDAPDGNVTECSPRADVTVVAIGEGGGNLAPEIAGATFAEGVAAMLDRIRPAMLLACGGETAHALLDRLGVSVLSVSAELAPGLPLCRVNAPWGEFDMLTKSGGFGGPHLLNIIAAGIGGRRDALDGEMG